MQKSFASHLLRCTLFLEGDTSIQKLLLLHHFIANIHKISLHFQRKRGISCMLPIPFLIAIYHVSHNFVFLSVIGFMQRCGILRVIHEDTAEVFVLEH